MINTTLVGFRTSEIDSLAPQRPLRIANHRPDISKIMASNIGSCNISRLGSKATSNSSQDSVSPEFLKVYFEYMRTPSPEPQETSRYWSSESDATALVSNSSPILSYPPSWLHDEYEHSALDSENEEDYLPCEVPLSSSPPDLTGSSPQSRSSDTSDDSSALVSSSNDCLEDLKDSTSLSQLNPSCVDLSTSATSDGCDDFGKRLHQLLLVAKEERDYQEQDIGSEQGGTDDLSGSENSDCGHDSLGASSGSSGISDEETNENLNISFGSPHMRLPNNTSDLKHRLEAPSLSQSNALEDMSPACFATQLAAEDYAITKPELPKAYRLIKRSQSYVPTEDMEEPFVKRQKVARDCGPHAQNRVYAHRTASLRRADSLRTTLGDISSPAARNCLPTVPATPVSTTPQPRGTHCCKAPEISGSLLEPVPVIAPPEGHIAKLPLSPETLAKIRLSRYLEREARGSEIHEDWLLILDSTLAGSTTSEWETGLGIGRRRREAVINWMLDVLPAGGTGRASSSISGSPLSSLSSSRKSSSSKSSYGTYYSSSGSESSSGCTTNTPEHSSAPLCIHSNLQDQLENSPETRFHAAWMFLRYFHHTMTSKSRSKNSPFSSKGSSIDEEGLNLLVWDIAIACLAISVKFHRDFLDPLLPVFAHEYVALAPHQLSHEDLESAHRDVLSAFDYMLGVTPQPVMDELWSALSSLRGLLAFDGGWKDAVADAWTRLFIVIDEPDVQRFPVSKLTVVALMDGILESLIDHYCRGAAKKMKPKPSAEDFCRNMRIFRQKFCTKAKEDAEGVFCDMQALTGITDVQNLLLLVDLRECRMWMARRN